MTTTPTAIARLGLAAALCLATGSLAGCSFLQGSPKSTVTVTVTPGASSGTATDPAATSPSTTESTTTTAPGTASGSVTAAASGTATTSASAGPSPSEPPRNTLGTSFIHSYGVGTATYTGRPVGNRPHLAFTVSCLPTAAKVSLSWTFDDKPAESAGVSGGPCSDTGGYTVNLEHVSIPAGTTSIGVKVTVPAGTGYWVDVATF